MSIPLFFPPPVYLKEIGTEGGIKLHELCTKAGVACRATGAWVDRIIVVASGDSASIEMEPGGWGTIRVVVPSTLTTLGAARYALGALAYSAMDVVARESIRGAQWAAPDVPRGRKPSGMAMSVRERQRLFRERKQSLTA